MNDFASAFTDRGRPPPDQLVVPSAGPEGEPLRALLQSAEPGELTAEQVFAQLTDNLWMLSPAAFRYYLPALMHLALHHYDRLSVFASELVGSLTEPRREDLVELLDRTEAPGPLPLAPETLRHLRPQQLAWFDSGAPTAAYRERMADLTGEERGAIRDFLLKLRSAHGEDFPFGEIDRALDRLERRPQS